MNSIPASVVILGPERSEGAGIHNHSI